MLEFAEWNAETKMQVAGPVVRRDDAAGHRGRFVGAPVLEQQEHLAAGDTERAHAAVVDELLEAEYALIERA